MDIPSLKEKEEWYSEPGVRAARLENMYRCDQVGSFVPSLPRLIIGSARKVNFERPY